MGNSFRITGISNPNEARQLSLLLRAGALMRRFRSLKNVPSARLWVCRTSNRVWKRVWPVWWSLSLFMIFFYKIRSDRDLCAGG
ncbi:hypothetical protein DMH17_04740 [Raoultella planticola]|nr:hypothetical protein [Raoultella planticola]